MISEVAATIVRERLYSARGLQWDLPTLNDWVEEFCAWANQVRGWSLSSDEVVALCVAEQERKRECIRIRNENRRKSEEQRLQWVEEYTREQAELRRQFEDAERAKEEAREEARRVSRQLAREIAEKSEGERRLHALNALAKQFPGNGKYCGHYKMFVPVIIKLWYQKNRSGYKIADIINAQYRVKGLHEPIQGTMVNYILLKEDMRKRKKLKKKRSEKARKRNIDLERIERNRPLDMGGPRDVWQVWTPEMQAREFGLI